jgi:phosphoribosylaminoimidazole (AIR) synthetase
MGIGMVLFIAPADLEEVARIWSEAGERWYAIGNVKPGQRRVVIEPPPRQESPS